MLSCGCSAYHVLRRKIVAQLHRLRGRYGGSPDPQAPRDIQGAEGFQDDHHILKHDSRNVRGTCLQALRFLITILLTHQESLLDKERLREGTKHKAQKPVFRKLE